MEKFKGKTRRIMEQVKSRKVMKAYSLEAIEELFPWMDGQARENLHRLQFCGKAGGPILNSNIQVFPVVAGGMLVYPKKELLKLERLHKLNASQKKQFWGALNGCTCIAEGMYWHDVLNAFLWAVKGKNYTWD
jgi:hypothetical protein